MARSDPELGAALAAGEQSALAEQVGAEIAHRGAVLVCGGLTGVMEAAARGAKNAGGLTIGILPGDDAGEANRFIDIPIVTGLGEARNVVIVKTCHALIAVGGAYGTLSEITFALRAGKTVVGLGTWDLPAIVNAASPADAVEKAYGSR